MKDFRMNFIHLCDDALFSQDGKLSLIGVFDMINLVSLPGSLLKAFLVFNMSILNKELSKVDLDIAIIKSGTKEEVFKLPTLTPSITNNPKDIDGEAKLGITLQLTNISFKETGKYILQVKANNSAVGSFNFMVNLLEQKKGEKK